MMFDTIMLTIVNQMFHQEDADHMTEKNLKKPTFWNITLSTLAAAFGVQSRRNQQRDFEHGSLKNYIIAGIIFTLCFIGGVAFLVSQVLDSHGL
jgi:hypothetical protein